MFIPAWLLIILVIWFFCSFTSGPNPSAMYPMDDGHRSDLYGLEEEYEDY